MPDAPRWLDDREQAAWRAFIEMHLRLFRHLERQLQRDSDLSAPDYEVLVSLSEAPDERLRPFELCEALQWEKSRLSHQLTRMERRGLVERRSCPTDGRGSHVGLTPAGRSAIQAAAPGHVEEIRLVFVDALDPEQLDQLAAASRIIADAVARRQDLDGTVTTQR